MAALNIRKLPDAVHAKLRIRAARHGRSMEAEARDILLRAVEAEVPLAAPSPDAMQAWFHVLADGCSAGMVDELIATRRAEAARESSR